MAIGKITPSFWLLSIIGTVKEWITMLFDSLEDMLIDLIQTVNYLTPLDWFEIAGVSLLLLSGELLVLFGVATLIQYI